MADLGITCHFLQIDSPCIHKYAINEGIRVILPDGSIIHATHAAELNLPQLPTKARKASLFPKLKKL